MNTKRRYKPIPNPRSVRYRTMRDGIDAQDCHEIRIALAMLCEDEGRQVMDSIIRNACYDAADLADLRVAERIVALGHGTKAKIGPAIACEVIDAISRMWDEYENGDELSG